MKFLFLILFFALIISSCGKSPVKIKPPTGNTVIGSVWSGIKQFGQLSSEPRINAITHDSSGNMYIVVTKYISNDLPPPDSIIKHEMHLTKLSPSGAIVWTKVFSVGDFNSFDVPQKSIYVDISGNIYMTFSASGELSQNLPTGNINAYLLKMNSSGSQTWIKKISPTALSQTMAAGLVIDSSGNIAVAGSIVDGSVIGSNVYGDQDAYVLKFTIDGVNILSKQITAPTRVTTPVALVIDKSDNLFLVSNENRVGVGTDGTVYKFNSSGALIWKNSIGQNGSTLSYISAVIGSAGNIFVVGNGSGVLNGHATIGSSDGIIARITQSGITTFTKSLGNNNSTSMYINSIVEDGTYIYLAGYSDGPFTGFSPFGYSDGFLGKYDLSGNKKWLRQIGDVNAVVTLNCLDILFDSNGKSFLFAGGETTGALDSNVQSADYDYYVTKYDVFGQKY